MFKLIFKSIFEFHTHPIKELHIKNNINYLGKLWRIVYKKHDIAQTVDNIFNTKFQSWRTRNMNF